VAEKKGSEARRGKVTYKVGGLEIERKLLLLEILERWVSSKVDRKTHLLGRARAGSKDGW